MNRRSFFKGLGAVLAVGPAVAAGALVSASEALASAPAVVSLPAGRYKVTEPIRWTSGSVIVGNTISETSGHGITIEARGRNVIAGNFLPMTGGTMLGTYTTEA